MFLGFSRDHISCSAGTMNEQRNKKFITFVSIREKKKLIRLNVPAIMRDNLSLRVFINLLKKQMSVKKRVKQLRIKT